jgi:hypothetical protein
MCPHAVPGVPAVAGVPTVVVGVSYDPGAPTLLQASLLLLVSRLLLLAFFMFQVPPHSSRRPCYCWLLLLACCCWPPAPYVAFVPSVAGVRAVADDRVSCCCCTKKIKYTCMTSVQLGY